MRTFVEKILNAERGSIVVREPDYVMSHDNSARVRFLFERIHGTRVYNPSQLVIAGWKGVGVSQRIILGI